MIEEVVDVDIVNVALNIFEINVTFVLLLSASDCIVIALSIFLALVIVFFLLI
jgi:hypothetical protein